MSDQISTTLVTPRPYLTRIQAAQGPAGVGANPATLIAIEPLSAGDFVNILGGGVRKASRANYSRVAHGFVLTDRLAGEPVVVQFGGINTALVGLTLGSVWLGQSGNVTSTPLTTGPGMVQQVGFATSPTQVNFQPGLPVVLAGTNP